MTTALDSLLRVVSLGVMFVAFSVVWSMRSFWWVLGISAGTALVSLILSTVAGRRLARERAERATLVRDGGAVLDKLAGQIERT